ncbi:MAG: TetR/AcrR family transcriptional regulator [Tissierellia bacterium]|nr:TetR/AcrR family transcriptional regulator [Tissierellia bacterium]
MKELLKRLENADSKKLNRIINSAMKEFGENDFERASTNNIIEDAQVSKGLLFHYFGSKENLYHYLIYFTITTMSEKILKEIDWDKGDILERIWKIIYMKLKLASEYPFISDFSVQAFLHTPLEEIIEIAPNFNMEDYNSIYTKNIDYSLFKEGLDIEKAVNVVRWSLDRYGEELMRNMKTKEDFHMEKLAQNFYNYLDFFRNCFYKEGSDDKC